MIVSKILGPDAEAEFSETDEKEVSEIVELINTAIRNTIPGDRDELKIYLKRSPSSVVKAMVKRMALESGWDYIAFEAEDRPCSSICLILRKPRFNAHGSRI